MQNILNALPVLTTLSVDIGFVFALQQESVGVLDRMKHVRTTCGDGWTFHTGKIEHKTAALVLSGVGQKKAEEAAQVLLDVFAPKIICSAGFAGGLTDRLKRSKICVPEQVVRESDGQVLNLSNLIPTKTEPKQNMLTLITVNEVAASPKQKRNLYGRTGAELVDMETFAVAEVCRAREIPFRSFRVILDAVDDRIPKDIAKILDNVGKGVPHFSGILLGSFFSRPSVVIDLVSLKRRAFTAAERLAQFTVAELLQQRKIKSLRNR